MRCRVHPPDGSQCPMIHAAKKIAWLDDQPYSNDQVKHTEIFCMECLAKPAANSTSMQKSVSQVLHVGDPRVIHRAKTPPSSASDQHFLHSVCNNSYCFPDDIAVLSSTAMWIAEYKDWHQTHSTGIESNMINRSWIAHITNTKQHCSKRTT